MGGGKEPDGCRHSYVSSLSIQGVMVFLVVSLKDMVVQGVIAAAVVAGAIATATYVPSFRASLPFVMLGQPAIKKVISAAEAVSVSPINNVLWFVSIMQLRGFLFHCMHSIHIERLS